MQGPRTPCAAARGPPRRGPPAAPAPDLRRGEEPVPAVTVTVVYDDHPGEAGFAARAGFACLVRGWSRTVLFDTGGDGPVLLQNLRRAGVDLAVIDAVVLSHRHGDHTGGLARLLRRRGGLEVYLPGDPGPLAARVRALGGVPRVAADSRTLCPGIRTTGTLTGGGVNEQALCVRARTGWLLISGCAHPGVDRLVARARQVLEADVVAVMGGFHLGSQSRSRVTALIDRLQGQGVLRAAPCHCSGRVARKLFARRLGERCQLPVVGQTLRF